MIADPPDGVPAVPCADKSGHPVRWATSKRKGSAMQPYVSVCLASRNDDYSGNMMAKRQWCLDAMLAACEAHALPLEIIFTDWNPPADHPPLRETLCVPADNPFVSVRVIEAPAWCHQLARYAEVFPFNLVAGFNVGLRRARGEFVVCKCTDVLWSQPLWTFLAARNLDPTCLYRTPRHDLSLHPLDLDPKDTAAIDAWCLKHTTQAHAPATRALEGFPLLFTNACGDFQLLSRQGPARTSRLLRGHDSLCAVLRRLSLVRSLPPGPAGGHHGRGTDFQAPARPDLRLPG